MLTTLEVGTIVFPTSHSLALYLAYVGHTRLQIFAVRLRLVITTYRWNAMHTVLGVLYGSPRNMSLTGWCANSALSRAV